jgi:hypothetical protein
MAAREVADGWRKSSTSGKSDCVEVKLAATHVYVRDTKDRSGTVLAFNYAEWAAFLAGVRLGEFDISADQYSS